ncbi:hypothetical protein PAXRUDRAFT_148485 [Paxillus rubicundulus Ve08.2h10]|uniref:Uncharacterized protein n=1 Tax=Paxillus rubicundulus Ve08.2h10 TaxID=930991 RepID=A0A0D0D5G7_9AGAM|nr:hypothetical protein PAXRUDRAFT_148485 [Paxillus rubicundulus Ve08.2h10]
MVQGKTKGLQAKASSSKARHAAKAAAAPKKGKRHEPPKKPALVKEASMRKKYISLQALKAKVTKSIEQQMVSAASAGKLTIMKNAAPEPYVFLGNPSRAVRSRILREPAKGLKSARH